MAGEGMLICSGGARINGARKVIKWIKKGISSKLNFLGDILQNKPKPGIKLEIKGKWFIFSRDTMKIMILKGHGEGWIFENITECDRMMLGNKRNNIKGVEYFWRGRRQDWAGMVAKYDSVEFVYARILNESGQLIAEFISLWPALISLFLSNGRNFERFLLTCSWSFLHVLP
jgi:hypothetical protein